MKAINFLMSTAPYDWQKAIDAMSEKERDELRKQFEVISEKAGILAGYLEERHGYGCGDQGHEKAVKQANRNGRMIRIKVFGYNGYVDLRL
jgi:hypothetical protein